MQAVRFINESLKSGSVLIYTTDTDQGDESAISAIAAGWIMSTKGLTVEAAVSQVRNARPSAKPSKLYRSQLKTWQGRPEVPE